MQKFAVFRSTEKSINYQDILDCRVSSGQATGIKILYLISSKNADYADINIIPQKLVFWKMKNYLPIFLSALHVHQVDKLEIILIRQKMHFWKKRSNGK